MLKSNKISVLFCSYSVISIQLPRHLFFSLSKNMYNFCKAEFCILYDDILQITGSSDSFPTISCLY